MCIRDSYQVSIQLEKLYGLESPAGTAAKSVAVGTRPAGTVVLDLDGVVFFSLGGVGVGDVYKRQAPLPRGIALLVTLLLFYFCIQPCSFKNSRMRFMAVCKWPTLYA